MKQKLTLRSYFRYLPSEQELLGRIKKNEEVRKVFEAWTAEKQQEYLDRCTGRKGFNILYDQYFKEVMNPEYDTSRLESFLEVVIGEKVRILKQLPNDDVRLEDENTLLVTDIIVELADGSIANVEVQKIGYMFTGPRCSCYLSDMMLRQYKRIRAKKKKAFSYGDIKKVYLIVLYETSPRELKVMPGTYLHRSRHVFDTGLEMDLLQRCVLIPLDIFKKTMQNKPIETLYGMNKDMVSAMGFFSEELRIMDRNTAKYMIDEMDDEIKRLEGVKNQLEGETNRLEGEKNQLEGEKTRLEGEKIRLEGEKNQLVGEKLQWESEKAQLESQNIQYQAQIAELLAEVQRLKVNQS